MKAVTLKAARDRRGWTQEELEAASGVDQTVISRLERRANANPTYETICKLEDALKLRRGTLVFGQVMEERAS